MNGALPNPEPLPSLSASPIPKPSFLTKNALHLLQETISKAIGPSWQAALPPNFGSPEHGKLKADQARSVAEFALPVALVKFHVKNLAMPAGLGNKSGTSQLVDLTMDMVTALYWGTSRRTSPYHSEQYRAHMEAYVQLLAELYPEKIVPNHHFALHIDELLLRFGPMHGWWAYPFERMIGVYQGLNTNGKLGMCTHPMINLYLTSACYT